jgi:hypothetical protein
MVLSDAPPVTYASGKGSQGCEGDRTTRYELATVEPGGFGG